MQIKNNFTPEELVGFSADELFTLAARLVAAEIFDCQDIDVRKSLVSASLVVVSGFIDKYKIPAAEVENDLFIKYIDLQKNSGLGSIDITGLDLFYTKLQEYVSIDKTKLFIPGADIPNRSQIELLEEDFWTDLRLLLLKQYPGIKYITNKEVKKYFKGEFIPATHMSKTTVSRQIQEFIDCQ